MTSKPPSAPAGLTLLVKIPGPIGQMSQTREKFPGRVSACCGVGMLDAWQYDREHDTVSRRSKKTIPTTNAVRNTLGSWERLARHFVAHHSLDQDIKIRAANHCGHYVCEMVPRIAHQGADVIHAGAGNDVVATEGGDDTVYLGSGNDAADGNEGDETPHGRTGGLPDFARADPLLASATAPQKLPRSESGKRKKRLRWADQGKFKACRWPKRRMNRVFQAFTGTESLGDKGFERWGQ